MRPAEPTPPPVLQSDRSRSLAVPLVVGCCLFFLVVIAATLITFILPEAFSSTARIRVEQLQSATPASPSTATATNDAVFLPTEMEVIQSEAVLGKVIEGLDLNATWGRKFAGGDQLKTQESLTILKGRLEVRAVPNTSIVRISVTSDQPAEAANIANAVAESYQGYVGNRGPQPGITESSRARVEILDRAVPRLLPVSPNKPLNIALGFVVGAIVGVAGGALVFALQRLLRPRKAH